MSQAGGWREVWEVLEGVAAKVEVAEPWKVGEVHCGRAQAAAGEREAAQLVQGGDGVCAHTVSVEQLFNDD